MHFGQCLRAILKRKNISQVEAARLLGMKQPSLAHYLNLADPPKRGGKLEFIAAKLGVTVQELQGEAPVPGVPLREKLIAAGVTQEMADVIVQGPHGAAHKASNQEILDSIQSQAAMIVGEDLQLQRAWVYVLQTYVGELRRRLARYKLLHDSGEDCALKLSVAAEKPAVYSTAAKPKKEQP